MATEQLFITAMFHRQFIFIRERDLPTFKMLPVSSKDDQNGSFFKCYSVNHVCCHRLRSKNILRPIDLKYYFVLYGEEDAV